MNTYACLHLLTQFKGMCKSHLVFQLVSDHAIQTNNTQIYNNLFDILYLRREILLLRAEYLNNRITAEFNTKISELDPALTEEISTLLQDKDFLKASLYSMIESIS